MSTEFFKGNRSKLLHLLNSDLPVILTANGMLQKSMDSAFPFKQDGNFWYLTGIDEPNIILVMDKGKEYLIIPERSTVVEAFDGVIDIEALQTTSGISEILSEEEGWKRLAPRIKNVKNIATLLAPPVFIEQLGMYTNPARRRLTKNIKQLNTEITLFDLRPHLQRMRMVKQPTELKAITKAVNITVESLKIIHDRFNQNLYGNEFEVELELSKEFVDRGGTGHGFAPIIAAGARACQLHPVNNKAPIGAKDALLMDVGAEYDHYAADLTRTWARQPNTRLQAVHKSVIEVQNFAMSLLKPGTLLREYESQTEKFMGQKLMELGLIKTADRSNVRKYYPHATSHYLGIDVHDAGDIERPLVAGTVLAVEPGIYIPEEGIGIRIEDDVVITDKGVKNLSASLPQSLF